MNRVTATILYVALTAWPGVFAHAQPAATVEATTHPTHRAGEPVVRCANNDAGSRSLQPCKTARPDEPMRLGGDVTRQEIECILSGVCGVGERARVNG